MPDRRHSHTGCICLTFSLLCRAHSGFSPLRLTASRRPQVATLNFLSCELTGSWRLLLHTSSSTHQNLQPFSNLTNRLAKLLLDYSPSQSGISWNPSSHIGHIGPAPLLTLPSFLVQAPLCFSNSYEIILHQQGKTFRISAL